MNKRPHSHSRTAFGRRPLLRALFSRMGLMVLGGIAILTVVGGIAADYWFGLPDEVQAGFVGRQSCIQCHQQEAKAWSGSHHDLAMDLATSETVLASFDNQELRHHGLTSRMFRRDGKYFVRTDGPDGQPADFQVKYVFGVTPLQQYMVEFDRPADMPEHEIGRVQVLRETWDTKRKKWFYQNPPDVQELLEPDDELHWTGVTQRWNTSCADCHSTNLQANFDLATRTFHTTFSEIDVSCEACHGPGSLHVQLASSPSLFWDRKRGYALARLKGESNLAQIEACAPCHSVRSPLHDGYASGERLYDYFSTALLRDQLYHPDGQILAEDYEYGSFTQSKMFHKNVRCSDCHNPHSLQLKHEGNKVCTNCHAHPAGNYDSPAHHNHKAGSAGASCIECHMPATTYMDVDPRRDHSLRIPRPDLSSQLGTPNACVACHIKDSKLPLEQKPKSPTVNRPVEYADWLREAKEGKAPVKAELDHLNRWADAACEKWYGAKRKKEPHFAKSLLAAREMHPNAKEQLVGLLVNRQQPTVARATAAMELSAYVNPEPGYSTEAIRALREALADKSPEIRAAASESLQNAPPDDVQRLLLPLLTDPVRMVRYRAAQGLSQFGNEELFAADERLLQTVLSEIESQTMNEDRAGFHLMKAAFAQRRGDLAAAGAEYETAIDLEPTLSGPRGNLAALFDQLEQPAEATRLRQEELEMLERDARRGPQIAPLQIQVGLLRHLHGWKKEAETALLQASLLEPRNPAILEYLVIYYRDIGRPNDALPLADRLLKLRPRQPGYEQLKRELLEMATQ